ncbi:MAG: hypothetical protein A2909_01765 [Candidatus Tagabacteria bacterium RIFCSPLOWO2_01_FULL_39_11]|uniref:Uncharacterized protein n=1 Tax=Candidatus Tagabacteria bacterium RIFCSPLOWO2_01_FULL_39_11 TaxID=1802295 RepID=A0A1G2LR91_9BACT|nr:MAG: hypothetical protein A2909_01765 [Candidatus Tagabacteria bacterium RIFCSPLOWO2_01_FULL_39_11]
MKKLYLIIFFMIAGIIAAVIFINFPYANKNGEVGYENDTISVPSVISLDTQISTGGAVTVAVTPVVNLSDWSFRITLDTHSADLIEDLKEVSAIKDEKGSEYKPIKWDGDPAGGHHRSGILRFGEITPAPQSVVLVIRQIGGIAERKFEWEISKN